MNTETSSRPSIRAGVVFGEDYKALVRACKAGRYALPAVNVVGTNSINAVLEAAARNQSDVVIQLSHGGSLFYAGAGFPDPGLGRVAGAFSAAQHVHEMAQHYGICVILHTDHANLGMMSWVETLVGLSEESYRATGRPLFSSHMLDLSEEPLEENLRLCARMLGRIAPLGMSLEIELGVTGGEEDGVGSEDNINNPSLYTQPEHVLRAWEVLSPMGHFSIAASFGNVHGVYKRGNVKLRPDILKNSQLLVQERFQTAENPLDLVFHGGSGSEKEQITETLDYGVFKMNIDTDTQFAFAEPVGRYVQENPRAFAHQLDPDTGVPYKKIYDPRKWLRAGEEGMIARLTEAFTDLRSAGQSVAKVI